MSLPYNCVRDDNIDHNLWRVFLAPNQLITAATTNVSTTDTTTSGYSTLTAGIGGTGAPIFLMQNASRIPALRISSANSVGPGAGSISAVFRPWNMDNRHPVYVRVHWSSNDATAAVATFNAFYGTTTVGTAPTTPTTALNRVMTSTAKGTAPQAYTITRPGMIAPLSTGRIAYHTLNPDTETVNFEFSLATKSAVIVTTAFVWVYGVEFLYTPRNTFGDGSGREGRFLTQVLQGNMETDPSNDFSV